MFDGRSGGAEGPPAAPPRNAAASPLILVSGASGYVGGRLVPTLEARGYRIRCLARRPEYLAGRFRAGTEVVKGDVLNPESLVSALDGVHTAYYFVHSMGASGDFEEQDRAGARNFARTARERGVRRIIYLGGLGGRELSAHLRSRQEVGAVLAAEGPQVVEFRASIVIGSGSLSFEMIRALVNKLPVMVTPGWVRTPTQPIAIDDVIAYLVCGLEFAGEESAVFEIGGPDRISYGGLMHEYARQIGVRRLMVPVPFLTTRLSSLWLGLVTPLYARVGRKLIGSLRNETVVHGSAALRTFGVRPLSVRQAIARALEAEDREMAATRWSDAVSSGGKASAWGGRRFGSRLVDRQQIEVPVAPGRAFAPIQRIGGRQGWYFATWLWVLRGFLDLVVGGVGMRRGRRHPVDLRPGDPLDFWRVEAWEENRLLRLCAEMKMPGRAWLQFEVEPAGERSRITQTAVFDPVGLGGLVYWYGLYPIHWLIFRRMLRGVAARAAAM
ncbi:MAG: SDR family oxidoreductase [Acidobacteriota bacterium]|nr:SDR family oxidoreductase [Acidobacteriota bacterium]MDE2711870.1 SDR family oxidoreductase [Acidobacteriota bacterium]